MSRTLPLLSRAIALGFLGSLLSLSVGAQAPSTAPHASDTAMAPSGVYYEIFVRAFADSNGDGIGDLNGITGKLDYLKSLGVSGLWLTPINPSPSYHGYDVTDYYGINKQFGTAADFQKLLDEAHKRGIAVIIDLVINHTSDQHPWFQSAVDPKNPKHDWYNWSNAHTDLKAISATDTPAWHALGDQHYLGTFTRAMPDLDYDTPAVRQEMIKLGRYWLGKGVDGFRLDAAQHIYFDLKSQRNDPKILAKNITWWSDFRHGLDTVKPDAYVVGEVTRDNPQEIAPYFKPLSAAFDFPLATQLIESAKSERAGNLGALLARTEAAYRQVTGKSGVDAPFLSNHDQNRVMSQLDGSAQHMRMAAAMLLTLPGHPFIYYGEELGMRGQKPDENIREPMRWHRDDHGADETHWKTFSAGDGPEVSVDAEQADANSLLHYYTILIGWRRQIGALRDGTLSAWSPSNPQIAAWQLSDAQSRVLVVHNLSGETQTVDVSHALGHRFDTLQEKSRQDIALAQGKLQLPPYSSAIVR
ncbi:glycosidase [Rhodanobacter sp. K2T2]|uniref:alpha-amylase family glycosyl hydrolase n=1 Tax=Rhodanobacter sp. K2T2 TaxID=2723085 RepID=UPI0015C71440|nr:alpha-amylase family glycosyl hydrolase [Rhodanobacter sp. K2T2]NYE28252.1 glycosidase [Rhodanobacter sp. K2T2]